LQRELQRSDLQRRPRRPNPEQLVSAWMLFDVLVAVLDGVPRIDEAAEPNERLDQALVPERVLGPRLDGALVLVETGGILEDAGPRAVPGVIVLDIGAQPLASPIRGPDLARAQHPQDAVVLLTRI